MLNTRNYLALGAAMAFAVVSSIAFAQDDLDALLKDLESDAAKQPAEKPAAESAKAEPVAEPAEAEPAKDEPPAEASDAAKDEPAEAEPAKDEPPAKASDAAKDEPAEAEPAKAEEQEPAKADPSSEASATAKEEAAPSQEEPVKVQEPVSQPDEELIENLRLTEKNRREALDIQAKREILEARQAMKDGRYEDAVDHYGLAQKFLNDRPSTKDFRKECDQGIAESLYRAALQENELGRRDRAVKQMEKAIDMRHPKARRVLEKWNLEREKANETVDLSSIKHRLNDEDYKESREQIRRHLKRSRQLLSVMDMPKALEECEIVLKVDPYNRDALRIRDAIQRKRKIVLEQERVATRDGMIADVDEKWRPVYAVNAAQLKNTTAETVKQQTGEDPERTMEQEIEQRMKAMRLPTISFKPPATIIDAVDFFRAASKDYDRPDIPIEKRGFNFVLKTPPSAIKQQTADAEQSDDFSSNDNAEDAGTANGLPPIPTIQASDLTFYEALTHVCDSVDYKFIINGSMVTVMPKDMSTAEILSRKYDVLDAFLERMTSASADVKEMRSAGFGGGNNKKPDEGEENQEKDWKGFFEQMGVKWPEGSSIMYIKTLGKLYVRNTRENLAEFEKVLQEMGSQPKLIEIETRFVEVSQEDLNSLGFEWILNSDYSLNLGDRLGKALGINTSEWGTETGSRAWSRSLAGNGSLANSLTESGSQWSTLDSLSKNGGKASVLTEDGILSETARAMNSAFSGNRSGSYSDTYSREVPYNSVGGRLIQTATGARTVGINAFGGTDSTYNRGNRYLSDTGNFISGGDNSNNDQFMKVNAFLGNADLSMILHMLSQRSDTDLLSAPKVVTKSGENAVIKVVIEYIYPQDYDVQLQSSGSSSGGSSGSSGSSQSAILAVVEPQNFTMREVGVILDVTPTYSEANGGTIDLELKPQVVDEPIWHNYGMKIPFTGNSASPMEVPDFGGIIDSMVSALNNLLVPLSDDDRTAIGQRVVNTSMTAIDNLSTAGTQNMTWYDAPMEQPWFPVRSIDSKVSITPGATVVMGGLIREQRKAMDDKIPFLGDLPFVGRLFRSHAEQTIKKNLLIFVTGRLITPSGRELTLNEETPESTAEVKPAPKAE